MANRLSDEDLAKSVITRFDAAVSTRGNWEGQWEEIAERVLPSYANSFQRRDATQITEGEKRTEQMVDATAALALPKFAAAMESMLTPRNSTWHRLTALDTTLRRNRMVRLYFDDVNDLLFRYRYAARANYASQQHEIYMGLGAFGTGSMFVDALDKRYGGGLRYRANHLSEVYFLENHQGIIDTCMRKFPLTARQAKQQFGDQLPTEIAEKADKPETAEMKFQFIHCVKPRDEEEGYDPERRDTAGMPIASYYVSITGKKVLSKGGYNTFPYAISRYVVAPGETYGRSPAMLALPAIKTLNEQKKTLLEQGHRAVRPVFLAHDDGVMDGFSYRPGSMNYGGVTADGKPLIHTLPVGNVALGDKLMDGERSVVNDAFLLTLFQILVETPQMTATEVLERAREKGALLSPTMGRQQSEFLGPMIDREIDVLGAQRLLPPMPVVLREALAEYEVVYDSPLSRAQRAEQAAGLMRTVDWAREYAAVSQDVSPLDWLNWDNIMPDLLDIQAVPFRWVRDMKGVAAVRQARSQASQQQQMIDAAPAAAGLLKAAPKGAPAA